MSDQLKTVLNRCVFSSALKLVRDEADRTLSGREFQTFGAHDKKQRAPITVHDSCSHNLITDLTVITDLNASMLVHLLLILPA